MTTYKVQVKRDGTYETNKETTDKRTAEHRANDLTAAGYDGRIVTAKGTVVQEWTLTTTPPSAADSDAGR